MHHSVLLASILREFRNHPGIVLTRAQTMARWSLNQLAAHDALETLTEEGFLTCVDGFYFWAEAPVPYFRGPHNLANRSNVLPFRLDPD
jgi:hypothetical protein